MKKLLVALTVFMMLLVSAAAYAQDNGETVGISASTLKSSTPLPSGQYALMAKYADDFLSGVAHRTLYAETLMNGTDDPNKADVIGDFFVVDIRLPVDFCAGHIEGAINIPYATIAKPENLALLPTDKPLLIVCYTGHTASVATGIYNMLGYDTWTLRFGMMGWNTATTMKVGSPSVSQVITGAGNPTVLCP